MDDYISREAAIEAISEECKVCGPSGNCPFIMNCHVKQKREALYAVPPADVRPVVHGYWTWNPNGMDWGLGAWCCDKCGAKAETWWANDHEYNPLRCSGGHYCGNCGAEMKGVQNG